MTVSKISFVLLGVTALAGPLTGGADQQPAGPDSTDKLTLAGAIDEALARSPAFQFIAADIDSARGEVLTARQKPSPELTFSPGIRRLSEGGGSHREFLGSLELSQTFLFPGKRELLVTIAERNVELRKLAIDGLRFQLSAAVRQAFYELLAAQALVDLRHQQLDSAQTFLDATTKRVEGGYASDFEAVKSRGDVINARKLLNAAEGEIAAAKVELNSLLGRDPAADLAISGTLDDLSRESLPGDLVAKALSRNPSLRVQAMQAEVAGLHLRKARLARKPDFTVGPSFEYSPSEQILGVGVSIPILNRNYGRGEILTATAEQRKVLAETERLRREIVSAVTKAATELATSRRELALYSPEYLNQLKAVVTQAGQGYAQNVTSLLVYLDAKRTYFDTLADYYEAIARVARSRAAVESAVGAPLDSFPSSSNP